MKIKLNKNQTLVLRTSEADGTSHRGFRWPKQGAVKCATWRSTKKCGNGLHGALMGEGNGDLFSWDANALWQVVRVRKDEIINLGGKVKFPRGYVMYSGDRKTATDIIYAHGGKAVIGGSQTLGDKQLALVGDYGTAVAGVAGVATAGNNGVAKVGACGVATVGNYGVAKAGNYGEAMAGNFGLAQAGNHGKAIVGDHGYATAGVGGMVIAGVGGEIRIHRYVGRRLCLVVGCIGKNGLKPNTKYKLNKKGKFCPVK